MAHLPKSDLEIVGRFGPHLAFPEGDRLDRGVEPDRVVKTHCCFCGQQCGIQLKVKDDRIIGFEPWEEFPFNHGLLCPKGVRRYLQGSHPDRLLRALVRDERAEGGFRPAGYEEAIRLAADGIARVQREHGPDAVAVLTGASLTNEKAYLMGKFARVCLKTSNIDYNGRLCMVSAVATPKKRDGLKAPATVAGESLEAGTGTAAGCDRERNATVHEADRRR